MENSDWLILLDETIQNNEKILHKRDYKFYQFDNINKIAKLTNDHLNECEECKKNKTIIIDLVKNSPDYLQSTISKRRIFDKNIENIKTHLTKIHHYYPKRYYASLYAFIGLVIGSAFGILLSFALTSYISKFFILVGFLIGIITGRIIGINKDKKNKNTGKILS